MSYINARKTRIQLQLTQVQTSLAALYAQMTTAAGQGVESYAFDTGEGSQRATRRKLSDIQNQIERLEATEEHLIGELYGLGLTTVVLRRKNPC